MKDKQILVFDFMFYLLWTGIGSSVMSVVFLGYGELQEMEKHADRLSKYFFTLLWKW
jgi:hypothetical protein